MQHATQDARDLVEISRQTLLRDLGWVTRFVPRHRHEFPVDRNLYEPIEATTTALRARIEALAGGYVALVGAPGSGKSTTGTATLAAAGLRLVRYYAFVPDAPGPSSTRGEAEDFLHDVTLQLRAFGFYPATRDTGEVGLQRQFHEQLRLLHEDYLSRGHKTVVFIDGLDHIPREYQPARSLLAQLPLPAETPEGVIIVVGTQRTDLADLPRAVRDALAEPARRVEMAGLTREAVGRILGRAKLPIAPDAQTVEAAYKATQGHPLSLAYLVERLRGEADAEAVRAVLQEAAPFGGDVTKRYRAIWHQLQSHGDEKIREILALACRLRGVVPAKWLAAQAGASATFERDLHYLFIREASDRWYFFHNSFRLFLRHATACDGAGEFDAAVDRAHHAKLAHWCASAAAPHLRWEATYHAAEAGEAALVIGTITAESLAAQLSGLRPIDAIVGDTRLLIQAAARQRDSVSLCRGVLLHAQYADREEHLTASGWERVLLELGDAETLIPHLRQGRRLLASEAFALEAAASLYDRGHKIEARRLFDLASPAAIAAAERHTYGERFPSEDWARAAGRVLPPEAALAELSRLRAKGNEVHHTSDDDETATLRANARQWLAVVYAEHSAWPSFDQVARDIDAADEDWLWVLLLVWRIARGRGETAAAAALSERIGRHAWPVEPRPGVAAALAVFLALEMDRAGDATRLLNGVLPRLADHLTSDVNDRDGPRDDVVRAHCALAIAAGVPLPPQLDPYPERTQRHLKSVSLLYAALADVGAIAGLAKAGVRLAPEEIERRALPILRLYTRSWGETREWTSHHRMLVGKIYLWKRIVGAVQGHGWECLRRLRCLCEQVWNDPEQRKCWGDDAVRDVVVEFFGVDPDLPWATRWLAPMEEHLGAGTDASGRLGEWISQAAAYAKLGRSPDAMRLLRLGLEAGYGVGYRKDDQMEVWIDWLRDSNRTDPGGARERLDYFARAVTTIEETSESGMASDAAAALVLAGYEHDPSDATDLVMYFHERGIGWFTDLLGAFFRGLIDGPDGGDTRLVLDAVTDFGFTALGRGDAELLAAALGGIPSGDPQRRAAAEAAERLITLAPADTRAAWSEGLARFGVLVSSDGGACALLLRSPADGVEASPLDRPALLKELLDDDKADVAWGRTVHASLRTRDGALALADEARGEGSAIALAAISRRLLALGDVASASGVARRAVAAARSQLLYGGWDRGRLAAFQALFASEGEEGLQAAWAALAEDASGPFRGRSAARGLRELLRLLDPAAPARVWPEVERHVRALFESADVPSGGPRWGRNSGGDSRPGGSTLALTRLLSRFMTHPVHMAAHASRRVLATSLVRGGPAAVTAIAEALGRGEDDQLAALQVVDSAVARGWPLDAALRPALGAVHDSPDLQVRVLARQLLGTADRPLRVEALHPDAGHVRPAILGLVLTGNLSGSPSPAAGAVRMFLRELTLLAEAVGASEEMLELSIGEVRGNLSAASPWDQVAEDALRMRIQYHGPKGPFVTLRARVSRRAVARVAAALVDAGAPLSALDQFLAEFRHHQPLLLRYPAARPAAVVSPVCPCHSDIDAWMAGAARSLPLLREDLSDQVIVAEWTILDGLRSEGVLEERAQCLHLASPEMMHSLHGAGSGAHHLFARVRCWPDDIEHLAATDAPTALAAQRVMMWSDTPAGDCLTLNPGLADHLGWKPASDELLTLVDSEGAVMARSVWWQDGHIKTGDTVEHADAGTGWLLLASRPGWERILASCGTLQRVGLIQRHAGTSRGRPALAIRPAEL